MAKRNEAWNEMQDSEEIESDDDDITDVDAGFGDRHRQPVGDLLQADVRPFFRPCRVFAQPVDQPPFLVVDERVVDSGATEIFQPWAEAVAAPGS